MKGKLIDMLGGIPSDKLLHFIVGLLICQITGRILGFTPINHYVAISFSILVTCAFAVAKELIDKKEKYNHFDNKDLQVSVLGALVGAILLL